MMGGGTPTALMPTPTGISMFPGEQVRLSRRWAERRFSNLIHFNELDEGGRFAALEQPEAFVDQLRATSEICAEIGDAHGAVESRGLLGHVFSP